MTNRPESLERETMRSSVMPSLKYSCSRSPLMLVKGSTESKECWVAAGRDAVPEESTRWLRAGAAKAAESAQSRRLRMQSLRSTTECLSVDLFGEARPSL